MKNKVVTVFGGTGFLGRHVVRLLAKEGAFVRVCSRTPEEGRHLLLMGDVGQICLERTNIRNDASIEAAVQGSDIVINLVGILYEKGKQTFQALHVEGARRIAEAVKKSSTAQLIHVSALGVSKNSNSSYARSKCAAESAILSVYPEAVIVRPSVIFGPEDNFFNMLARYAQFGGIGLIHEKTKFQPIYVDDVARAIVQICKNNIRGRVFELGGDKIYTFRELAQFIVDCLPYPVRIVSLPTWLGMIIGFFGQLLPKPFLTVDQVRLSQHDSILSGKTETLKDLGITPQALEGIVPSYLTPYTNK